MGSAISPSWHDVRGLGANVGYFSLLAARCVGENGRVIAFEPSPRAAAHLAQTIERNHITQIQLEAKALGDERGELPLFLHEEACHSPSLVPQTGIALGTVPVVRLDDYLLQNGIEHIDLIKIDVEGFEPNVIRGLSHSLEKGEVDAILCELNDGWLTFNHQSAAQLHQLIEGFGFKTARTKDYAGSHRNTLYLKAGVHLEAASSGAEGDVDRLVFDHFFASQKHGVFIEVGAARPDFLSIGALFRARGWRVISVEPNPVFCEMHRAKDHEILQYACGASDEDEVDFSIVHSHEDDEISNESFSSLSIKPGYSALKADLDIEQIRVSLRRLDTILHHHAPEVSRVDCASIDVEGWELEVLSGFDLERFKPRVLIIENLLDDAKYRDYMAQRGYRIWKTVHPNEIYLRSDETL